MSGAMSDEMSEEMSEMAGGGLLCLPPDPGFRGGNGNSIPVCDLAGA